MRQSSRCGARIGSRTTPRACFRTPPSTEFVQVIVKVAFECGVRLWPVLRGKNFAYGGAAPVLSGPFVLDLNRMNRILEADADFGYALVEPGVSFFNLYEHIQAKGLKLWLDVPDPAWGSVVGNALDHGVGYTPYGVTSACSATWRWCWRTVRWCA